MLLQDNRTKNGTVNRFWQSIDEQRQRAEKEVAAHPEAGLLLAAIFGLLLGIWIKRR